MTGYDDEAKDLVALHAMDALDDLERTEAEHLVERSPEAARDLARYTDALAALVDGTAAVEPPARTWDAVAATIRNGPTAPVAPAPPMTSAAPVASAAPVPARQRPRGRFLALAAAVVVLALGAVTVRGLVDSGPSARARMTAALARPTTRVGALASTAGSATIAIETDGTGWVDIAPLPDPGAGNVYQLWSLDSGAPVSLGVVKPSGGVARFAAPPATKQIALSKERSGGATSPTLPPVGAAQLD